MRLNQIISLRTLAVVCLSAASAYGLSLPRNARKGDFSFREAVAPGRVIEVKGEYGSIRAEPASGSEVEVTAVKHSARSNPAEVQIRTVRHAGGVTICAVYPSADPTRPNTCGPGDTSSHVHNNDVRVDFIVRVPAGVRLVARNVEGDIEVSSLGGNVEAYSSGGNIRISTAGYARATTVTGSITASMGRADWAGQLGFETSTGEITLRLPGGTGAEVHAESITGDISTEFPLTVHAAAPGAPPARSIDGVIGSGGRKLRLKTVSGAIRLERQG